MEFALQTLIIGMLLITMALSGTWLRQLPVSTAMLYLAVGVALGPVGLELIEPDPWTYPVVLERAAEAAVLISLFAVGLKLGLPFSDPAWRLPLRLAVVSMIITVALITAIGVWGLGLPLGGAVLLGAILAPTDPVLASDVQLVATADRDRVRFSLTGEGGLNDGSAFPFVMLGLGLLGLHDLGTGGWRWLAVDVIWAVGGGLLIGGVAGTAIGRLVMYLRRVHKASVGLDEFLVLGLIAVAYGLALLSYTYGFLAVLSAGLFLQRAQGQRAEPAAAAVPAARLADAAKKESLATHEKYAGAYLMQEVQSFNDQLEKVVEVAIVLVVGAMLAYTEFPAAALWFVPLLLLVVRPLSVWGGLVGAPPVSRDQRVLISWFGIRGIGSIYYLLYAVNHGLARPLAEELVALTLAVVATSIVLHGISMTPLMNRYQERKARRRAPAASRQGDR